MKAHAVSNSKEDLFEVQIFYANKVFYSRDIGSDTLRDADKLFNFDLSCKENQFSITNYTPQHITPKQTLTFNLT